MAETMVKICGLANLEDALWARACGADMLGFIMVPSSPRYVTPERAARITRALRRLGPGPRGEVALVGVFADRRPDVVRLIAELCALDLIQLHGHEAPEQAALYDRPVILARRLDPSVTLRPPSGRRASVATTGGPSPAAQDDDDATQPWAILLDTYDPQRLGGSGRAWDWSLLGEGPRRERLIVAGGLTPDNVAVAMRAARPWGVDVSSGVEAGPRRKDRDLVRRFIRQVREEDRANDHTIG